MSFKVRAGRQLMVAGEVKGPGLWQRLTGGWRRWATRLAVTTAVEENLWQVRLEEARRSHVFVRTTV
jgi:hypothetical protein